MLIVSGADLVWTGVDEQPGGTVACDGPRVVEAGRPGEVLDATGCVVTPGLVNAHHHLLQTAFRTLPGTRGVPMREWLPTMAAAYAAVGIDAELRARRRAAGLAEGLLCGVTTVADHHLTWPARPTHGRRSRGPWPTAAASSGRGCVFVRGQRARRPRAGRRVGRRGRGLGPGRGRADGMVQVAVGPAGVHSDGARDVRGCCGEVAARHGLRRRTQANEQVDIEIAAQRYGRRPLELLDEWGWLAPDVTDRPPVRRDRRTRSRRLAARGVSATHAPGCDLPMGWGIAPAAALPTPGSPVGLGTSGGGSNDAGPPPRRRAARDAGGAAAPGARLTRARGAGHGHARVGARGWAAPSWAPRPRARAADLVRAGTSPAWPTPVSPTRSPACSGRRPGRRPRHVVVAGRVVVRDGELVARPERDVAEALRALLHTRESTDPAR